MQSLTLSLKRTSDFKFSSGNSRQIASVHFINNQQSYHLTQFMTKQEIKKLMIEIIRFLEFNVGQ